MRPFASYRPAALAALTLVAFLAVAGCSNDDKTETPPQEFAPPTNLAATNGDQSIDLAWDASPDENSTDFRRYNIYRGPVSLLAIDPASLEQYRVGSVEKGVRNFQLQVTNGTLYFFHVRAEKKDGGLSAASNEAKGAGRAEGSDRIIEEFASSGDSGFDFSTGLSVSLSTQNEQRFDLTDLYLGTGAADDDPGSPLALKSPELLARLNDTWLTKIAKIKSIGTDWNVSTTNDSGWSDQANVTVGTVYAIKTPSNNYAKMQVQLVEGDPGSRSISFRYAYQTAANLALF